MYRIFFFDYLLFFLIIVYFCKKINEGKMQKKLIYFVLVFLLTIPFFLYSQERQIPIDSTNNIFIVDIELEKLLNLFPEINGFNEAKLFQKTDSSYILEIIYYERNNLMRKQLNYSQSQLNSLRKKIAFQLAHNNIKLNLNQDGRVYLITGTTLLSIYYGISLASISNANANVSGAIDLFTIGAGFFVPFYLTKNIEVTYGMSNLAVGSGAVGLGIGYCLNDLAHISFELNDQYILPTLTSVSGILGGYYYAKENKITEGKANAIVDMSLLGAPYLAGISYTLIGDNMTNNQISGSFLLGSMGGALLGNTLSNKYDYAPGDAEVFSTSTLLATAETAALLAVLKTQDAQTAVGIMVLGATFGGLRGNYLVSDVNFSDAQGNYLALGALGGGLIGTGISLIAFQHSNDNDVRFIPLIVTLAAELGFDITYNSIVKSNMFKESNSTGKLDFNFNPLALTNNVRETNKYLQNQIPFFNISYQW